MIREYKLNVGVEEYWSCVFDGIKECLDLWITVLIAVHILLFSFKSLQWGKFFYLGVLIDISVPILSSCLSYLA